MFSPFGRDLFGGDARPRPDGVVAARFGLAPFSVLDARSGIWQERKRAWLSIGIESEAGRKCRGKISWADHVNPSTTEANLKILAAGEGPSVFDPALCESVYRWFTPPGGQVVDPFAGGSVRGIVAGALGFRYWGSDLRAEQIAANEAQAEAIRPAVMPRWIVGDSMETLASAPDADLVFSCPPYGDLERYSDDPRDLSAMEWHTFAAAYKRIVLRAVERLRADSFACFVVGDFRDGRGFYRGFVGETVSAFENAGAKLYNDAVLVTAVGSASLRVARQFEASRKLTKIHQNVLVFCKGNPARAAARCRGETL